MNARVRGPDLVAIRVKSEGGPREGMGSTGAWLETETELGVELAYMFFDVPAYALPGLLRRLASLSQIESLPFILSLLGKHMLLACWSTCGL